MTVFWVREKKNKRSLWDWGKGTYVHLNKGQPPKCKKVGVISSAGGMNQNGLKEREL